MIEGWCSDKSRAITSTDDAHLSRVLLFRGRVDSLQSSLSRAETNPKPMYSQQCLKFLPALGLPIDATTESDRDIHDVHLQLTKQSQRQPANDHLVVGMGRKDQEPWSASTATDGRSGRAVSVDA